MITIDGSAGEGGGQILRTALGLSLVSGRPFHIHNIRANRKKPGLMRQHLTAVRAAEAIGDAGVEGAGIGSQTLSFDPGRVQPGSYQFSIGTAGSCTLVFQAVLPALLAAEDTTHLVLEGGTHNPMAPPFDFLKHTFLPILRQMGAEVEARLLRPGFFPAGGGRIEITVKPANRLQPIELMSLTNITLSAHAVCAQLPQHISRRELKVVKDKLGLEDDKLKHIQLDEFGPGNTLSIFVRSDQLTETFTGFGQKNLSAEKVALKTVKQVKDYILTQAPVGKYLADQLLIPIALAGSGRFLTDRPTDHTLTNIEIIKKFLDSDFRITQAGKKLWEIALSSES